MGSLPTSEVIVGGEGEGGVKVIVVRVVRLYWKSYNRVEVGPPSKFSGRQNLGVRRCQDGYTKKGVESRN